ncbi:MAG: hypothetical protein IJD90_02360, partial [Clostridia bacterium]|nr:hypothetical protein [Clostridia bacterium]
MKTKLIDKNIVLEGLHQLKTAGLICFIISIAGNILSFISNCIMLFVYGKIEDIIDPGLFVFSSTLEEQFSGVPFISTSSGVPTIYIFTPIFTFVLFKFLFKRNASDFYHSLSVKRETLFCSFSLSALIMSFSIVAICGLFSIVTDGFILGLLNYSSILPNLLNIIAGCLLIQSVVTIGCAVS